MQLNLVSYYGMRANPVEVDGFFSGRKNPEHMSSGRDFRPEISDSLKNLKPEKKGH